MGFGRIGVAYIFEEDGKYCAYVVAPGLETYIHLDNYPDEDSIHIAVRSMCRFVTIAQSDTQFWLHAQQILPELQPTNRAYDLAPEKLVQLNIAVENVKLYAANQNIAQGFKDHAVARRLWFRLNGIELEFDGKKYDPVVPFFEEDELLPTYEDLIVETPRTTARLNSYGVKPSRRWF